MSEEEKGYGKPPKKHQFKKGVSGNPRGRPKGKSSLLSDLNKIVNQKISVNLNGQNMRLTKRQAFLQRVANDAIAGGAGAGRLLYELLKRNKQDQAILESFLKLLGPDLPNKQEGK
jgi:hypothetical protein